MSLSSISLESVQAFHEQAAELMQYGSSGWLSSALLIDLIESNYDSSPMWPKAYEALKKTAAIAKALLKEMNFQPERLNRSIENILAHRSSTIYTFTHSKDFIENADLLKLHLVAQVEKSAPFSTAVLASLLFVAAAGSKYSSLFQSAYLNPPSTVEKTIAIQAYRAGKALRNVIDQAQAEPGLEPEKFKKELSKKLAYFARELTLYYQSLELLSKPSAHPLLETQ